MAFAKFDQNWILTKKMVFHAIQMNNGAFNGVYNVRNRTHRSHCFLLDFPKNEIKWISYNFVIYLDMVIVVYEKEKKSNYVLMKKNQEYAKQLVDQVYAKRLIKNYQNYYINLPMNGLIRSVFSFRLEIAHLAWGIATRMNDKKTGPKKRILLKTERKREREWNAFICKLNTILIFGKILLLLPKFYRIVMLIAQTVRRTQSQNKFPQLIMRYVI